MPTATADIRATGAAPGGTVTADTVLGIHPRVSVRPEPFGALLYHFGTRRLSFLKSPLLRTAVEALGTGTRVGDALTAAEVPEHMRAAVLHSLGTLRDTEMLVESIA